MTGMGDSYRLLTILRDGLECVRLACPIAGAEIGVHRGDTSALLLRDLPTLRLIMVDPWDTYPAGDPYRSSGDSCARFTADEQDQNMRAAESVTKFASSRRTMIRLESRDAARQVARGSLDFAFVDGDHRFEAVRLDIACWWPKVRSGGLLCGHDIDHPRDRRGLWGVRLAVEEHERSSGVSFGVLGSCWWFVKP